MAENCCEGKPYYNACYVCLVRRHRWLIKQLKEKEAALNSERALADRIRAADGGAGYKPGPSQ